MRFNRYIENFINIIKDIKQKNKKMVFFGAGNIPKTVLEILPVEVSYCVDNDSRKHGSILNGVLIKDPECLLNEDKEDLVIIVTSIYYDEISKQLKNMGFLEEIHFIGSYFLYKSIVLYKDNGLFDILEKQMEKLFNYNRLDFNSLKKILMVKKEQWGSLNYHVLDFIALINGYEIIFLDEAIEHKEDYQFSVDENIKTITYKDINLYNIAIHNICIELDILMKEIDVNIPLHKEVILKWYKIASQYIDKVDTYIKRYYFDKAIIFQGHMYDCAIVRQLSIQNNIDVFSFEFTFNKNKVIWDNVSGLSVNKNLAKNYFWRYSDIIDLISAREYAKKYIENIKDFKVDYHDTPKNELIKDKFCKTIVYIGQVYTDSSVAFGIKRFNNSIEIIKTLVDFSIENGYELIIKLHPAENKMFGGQKYNKLTYRKIEEDRKLVEKIKKHFNIIIDYSNKYDTYKLIDRSDLCVTINSQAGLEALLKGKDVILCGSSSYDGLGFTYEAQNQEMLKFFLDMVLKLNISLIDKDQIDKFFYIFNEFYCIEKNELSIIGKVLDNDEIVSRV